MVSIKSLPLPADPARQTQAYYFQETRMTVCMVARATVVAEMRWVRPGRLELFRAASMEFIHKQSVTIYTHALQPNKDSIRRLCIFLAVGFLVV